MNDSSNAVRTAARGLFLTGLLVALSLSAVAAQSPMQNKVDVRFEFSAAGQDLPAGSYRVTMGKDEAGQVELVLQSKGSETRVPVITRLAPVGGPTRDVKFVFDTTDGKRTLSEVWLPTFDGFLVNAAKGEHEHVMVDESTEN